MSWKVRTSKEAFSTGYFKLRIDEVELSDGRVMPRYYVVEFPTWVHVVALTENQDLIMLRQYRHAAQGWFIEVPGGTMDPKRNESPEEAAHRELEEETGYVAGRLEYLGKQFPNPALQSNAIHTYLAHDCRLLKSPNLDPYEELEVQVMPIRKVLDMVDRGEIQHSLMLSCLALARRKLEALR